MRLLIAALAILSFNANASENLSSEQIALIEGVNTTSAKSAQGSVNSLVCRLARDHVAAMATDHAISHDGFSDRSREMSKAGATNTAEIVAMNCGPKTSLESAGAKCANQWLNSPGHWTHMERYWDAFCYTMQKGSDGCYYCIGLFADGL
jgi:uncharacterized protein YkwD